MTTHLANFGSKIFETIDTEYSVYKWGSKNLSFSSLLNLKPNTDFQYSNVKVLSLKGLLQL